jgi:hypothetical protein
MRSVLLVALLLAAAPEAPRPAAGPAGAPGTAPPPGPSPGQGPLRTVEAPGGEPAPRADAAAGEAPAGPARSAPEAVRGDGAARAARWGDAAPCLAALAWLAGHWVDEPGGDLSEEVWTEPHGDSMLGMWRWVSARSARAVELLAIGVEAGRPVLRLRHFDGRLVAREERDRPLTWPLLRTGPREAVFEGSEGSGRGKARLTYRSPDPDTLVAILEKGGKPQEFRYRRR